MYSDTYLNENFKQGGIGDISAQTASKLMKYQNNQAYSFDKNDRISGISVKKRINGKT